MKSLSLDEDLRSVVDLIVTPDKKVTGSGVKVYQKLVLGINNIIKKK